jgi:diguanylate cyclase (GGDEF)-like protein
MSVTSITDDACSMFLGSSTRPSVRWAVFAIPALLAWSLGRVLAADLAAIALAVGLCAAFDAALRSRSRRADVRRSGAPGELDLAGHHALRDELTGLANRHAVYARLTDALSEEDARAAIVVLDVDGFKDVNDTLGHLAGDLVLRQVAQRLEHVALEADLLGRLGADEFVVVLVGPGAEEASAVGRRLRDLLDQPLEVDGLRIRLGTSLGIAVAPRHATTADELVRRADVAMNVAKEQRTGIEVYAAEHDGGSPARLALTAELHTAIESGQLEVHFQPKAHFATGEVFGAEALVRWRHPEHGLMPPAAFLPLAERSGLMGPLALFVLERAIGQCAAWRAGGRDLTVAVNLSVTNLSDPDLPNDVAALLRQGGLEPRHLELEITEDIVIAQAMGPIGVLHELKELGVRLALDDFGTGYSSLAYLKHLAVDTVKIDRAFVRDVAGSREDAAIVRSIVALAHALDLTVVAEGVASQASWHAARAAGCDIAQGFWLGRPLPAERFVEWLGEREVRRAA